MLLRSETVENTKNPRIEPNYPRRLAVVHHRQVVHPKTQKFGLN